MIALMRLRKHSREVAARREREAEAAIDLAAPAPRSHADEMIRFETEDFGIELGR